MRKKAVLQALPLRNQLKKDLKAAEKVLVKASKEVERLGTLVAAVDGVVLHAGFPVRVVPNPNADGLTAVVPAAEEVSRTAMVQEALAGDGKLKYDAYGNADASSFDVLLGGFDSKADALRAAKDYVAGVKS